jgi:hypothetical protein
MAGSMTDALEARLLDHLFKNGASPALPALATVYVALFTVVPSDSAAGTEVAGSSYARQGVAAANWTRSGTTPTQVVNAADVLFPTVTTSAYTVVGWGLFDAVTTGNFLYWGDISPSVTCNVGDQGRFAASTGLTVTAD